MKSKKKSKAPKRDSGAKAARTRARIVRKAIELFNRHGIEEVTVERIAASLQISPGNLTYHYRRKQDLIRAVFDVLQQELREELQPQTFSAAVKSSEQTAEYVLLVLRTFWKFKFLFTAVSYLARDRQLRKRYTDLRDWAAENMTKDSAYLESAGFLSAPPAPNSFRVLAENTWSLWASWLQATAAAHARSAALSNEALFDGAFHHWSLFQPLMTARFAREMLDVYAERLGRKI